MKISVPLTAAPPGSGMYHWSTQSLIETGDGDKVLCRSPWHVTVPEWGVDSFSLTFTTLTQNVMVCQALLVFIIAHLTAQSY